MLLRCKCTMEVFSSWPARSFAASHCSRPPIMPLSFSVQCLMDSKEKNLKSSLCNLGHPGASIPAENQGLLIQWARSAISWFELKILSINMSTRVAQRVGILPIQGACSAILWFEPKVLWINMPMIAAQGVSFLYICEASSVALVAQLEFYRRWRFFLHSSWIVCSRSLVDVSCLTL